MQLVCNYQELEQSKPKCHPQNSITLAILSIYSHFLLHMHCLIVIVWSKYWTMKVNRCSLATEMFLLVLKECCFIVFAHLIFYDYIYMSIVTYIPPSKFAMLSVVYLNHLVLPIF